MQSLVITVKGLKWGTDDSKDAMLGRALSYLVLYSTLGMMVSGCSAIRMTPKRTFCTSSDGRSAFICYHKRMTKSSQLKKLTQTSMISTTTAIFTLALGVPHSYGTSISETNSR
jgi:ABC-type spermidine/putrescine transport system permease subunit I